MSHMLEHVGLEAFSEQSMSDILKKLNPIELQKYNRLRKPLLQNINDDYKKLFKDFYYCTDMKDLYEEVFFSILEDTPRNQITFDFVIEQTTQETGEFYPFLCSNLVHLVNENKPIFSANTLISLGFENKIPTSPGQNLAPYKDLYQRINSKLNREIEEEWFKIWKYRFNEYFENYEELLDFSDMKMIDLFCWRNKIISDFGNIRTSDFNIPYERTYLLSRIRTLLNRFLPRIRPYSPNQHILRRAKIDEWLQWFHIGLIQYLENTIGDDAIPGFINYLENGNYASPNYINELRTLNRIDIINELDLSNALRLIEFNDNTNSNIARKIIDIRNHWAHPTRKNGMGTLGDDDIRNLIEYSHIFLTSIKNNIRDTNDIGEIFFREYQRKRI